MGRITKRINMFEGLLGKIKKRDEDASFNNAVNAMFPTQEHVNAAIRMQNNFKTLILGKCLGLILQI